VTKLIQLNAEHSSNLEPYVVYINPVHVVQVEPHRSGTAPEKCGVQMVGEEHHCVPQLQEEVVKLILSTKLIKLTAERTMQNNRPYDVYINPAQLIEVGPSRGGPGRCMVHLVGGISHFVPQPPEKLVKFIQNAADNG
jgi:hypothetical protein